MAWTKSINAAVSLLLLSSCGFYSFTGSLPPHIKTISIPVFVNETAEFGVAEAITDGVTKIFIEENILKVVDEDNAHSVLRGTIKKVNDQPYTYSEIEEVQEYRLNITVAVEWFDVVEDKVRLSGSYSGWGAYSLTEDVSSDGIDNDGDGLVDAEDPDETGDPRDIAVKIAVEKITTDLINDIISMW
ncbi:MAG: LPS assembly lipoprotein LptE [Fidelibacterota bacterium]